MSAKDKAIESKKSVWEKTSWFKKLSPDQKQSYLNDAVAYKAAYQDKKRVAKQKRIERYVSNLK